MATYKVLQDIEAEDKLVGPLTLWQFIYGLVTLLCVYLSGIAVMNNMPYFLILLVPIALFVGFLAIPWGGDQPTEVWALAKLRFFLKPRRRIWDQTGMTELVTVTAPKHEERVYTNGLSQREVSSRLHALASTLDSRGWAVKNVNVNVSAMGPSYSVSDRLFDVSSGPQEDTVLDIRPGDDILDEEANPVAHTFDTMIDEAASEYHKALVERMNDSLPEPPSTLPAQDSATQDQPAIAAEPLSSLPVVPSFAAQVQPSPGAPLASQPVQPATDFWFAQQPATTTPLYSATSDNPQDVPTTDQSAPPIDPMVSIVPQAGDPTDDETALLEAIKTREDQQDAAYDHLKSLKTPEQLEEEARLAATAEDNKNRRLAESKTATDTVTAEKQAAIMNFSRSNDLTIDTLARQAKQTLADDNEVVISLR